MLCLVGILRGRLLFPDPAATSAAMNSARFQNFLPRMISGRGITLSRVQRHKVMGEISPARAHAVVELIRVAQSGAWGSVGVVA